MGENGLSIYAFFSIINSLIIRFFNVLIGLTTLLTVAVGGRSFNGGGCSSSVGSYSVTKFGASVPSGE